MGIYRFVYNKTIDFKEKAYENGEPSGYLLCRKDWKAELVEQYPWIDECAAHTVYGAMQDADSDYKAMVRKRTKGLVSKLPRCKKRTQRTFFLLGNSITPKGMYVRLLGVMKSAETLPNKPGDSRILLENDKWYLLHPRKVTVTSAENQGRFCAIDPGVRTFATIFGCDGLHKIGENQIGRLVRLGTHLDNLISRGERTSGRENRSIRKAVGRAFTKIANLVKDFHYQSIGWLVRNYDTIIFPEANFTSAVKKIKRKIRRKTVRALLTWSFAKFRDRLAHKCELLSKELIVVNEAYTSKTANWTGEIVSKLGGRKSISSRGTRLDRDVNGAFGILLKALIDHPRLLERAIINKG